MSAKLTVSGGILAGYIVLFLIYAWSYIRMLATGPGLAKDVSKRGTGLSYERQLAAAAAGRSSDQQDKEYKLIFSECHVCLRQLKASRRCRLDRRDIQHQAR